MKIIQTKEPIVVFPTKEESFDGRDIALDLSKSC
jgi:hypothetical protein